MQRIRHITLPGGFAAAGVHCGIKTSQQEDLTILAAETDAACAVLTTRNQVVGAPILWNRRVLPRGCGRMRGIVVNSGSANVCTGAAGLRDAETMAALRLPVFPADGQENSALPAYTWDFQAAGALPSLLVSKEPLSSALSAAGAAHAQAVVRTAAAIQG